MDKKKFDILCFGSLTLDIFMPLSEDGPIKIEREADSPDAKLTMPLGEKIGVRHSLLQAGGGAANTAVGFSKLGLKPAAFGVVGDQSYRRFIMSELEEHNVCTDYLTDAKNQSSSFSIILNSWEGERTVLHRRTVCENFNEQTLLAAPCTRALYFGHLCASGILEAIPSFKARNPAALVAWNPGSTQFKLGFDHYKAVFPHVDCLFINREEAEAFSGQKAELHPYTDYTAEKFGRIVSPYKSHEPKFLGDLRPLATTFLQAGVKTVIITDGKQGAQIFTATDHILTLPQGVTVVDTLGAGDAFAVGFVAAQLHGKSIDYCTVWGSFNAGSVIQKFGAQPGQLQLPEVEAMASELD